MRMVKRIARTSVFLGIMMLIFSQNVIGQEDPQGMMKSLTDKVMNALRTNREALKSNPGKIYSLVDTIIIPHADFAEMGRWVVGRNAWQASSDALKQEFIKEFKTLVVRTYASALLGYTDQTVEFLPLRGGAGGERVQVSSLVRQAGKKPLRLDYRLIKQGGNWKLYDIIIEGISIVQGYRAQFANDARSGGLQAVIDKIRIHNRGRGGKK